MASVTIPYSFTNGYAADANEVNANFAALKAFVDASLVQVDGSVQATSAAITDGTIVNADINASAAIAQSKVATLVADLAAKAPLASPSFSGTVTAPTFVGALTGNVTGSSGSTTGNAATATYATTAGAITGLRAATLFPTVDNSGTNTIGVEIADNLSLSFTAIAGHYYQITWSEGYPPLNAWMYAIRYNGTNIIVNQDTSRYHITGAPRTFPAGTVTLTTRLVPVNATNWQFYRSFYILGYQSFINVVDLGV